MNSTTGDFSELRKSTFDEEIYNRGAHSCFKRRPRKLINLKPLNLNGIKKEIEGAEEDEKQSVVKISTYSNRDNERVIIEDQGRDMKLSDSNVLKDIVNTDLKLVNTVSENSGKVFIEKSNTAKCQSSNENFVSEVKENRPIFQEPKNDSFDLDFSALSLSTPVKQNSVNLTSNCIKPENKGEHFQQFVTPKIRNVMPNQCSSSRKSISNTPLFFNSLSAKKVITPYKPTFSQQILPTLPENECVVRNDDKGSNTFPNYPKDTVATPSHKIPMKQMEDEPDYKNENNQCLDKSKILRDDTFKRIKVNNVEYIMFNLIGKGGSSEVYQCYNLENKIHVAIKCVSLQNSVTASGYINEVKLLQKLQSCSKIIKMYDYEILEPQKKLLVVLENGGKDLSTILKHLAIQKSHIPMYMLLFYWLEMLYAVKQIHSNGIIHSDLKPANFLRVDEGLKLIDFGIASAVQTDMTSVIKTKQEGSCNYISPEALNSDCTTNFGNSSTEKYKIHYKSDVWSLGCILYQLVYRRTPFQHITQLWPKLAAIMNPEHKIHYPDVDWVSPKIIRTIKKCLQYNVKSRPSIDELIAEYDTILYEV